MKTFLGHIAEDLLREYGKKLYSHTLVFPNRRAGLYFTRYLSETAGDVIWSPKVVTINELFSSFSDIKIAEPEYLIFELYSVYKNLNPKAEGFDGFYFWGEMLINDFDNVDKYLVEPARIYSNLRDLKEIDSRFGSLTEEQAAVIRQFWINFSSDSLTGEKEGFLEIWNILPGLYEGLRESLRKSGVAYEGMIFRDLAEKCLAGSLPLLKSDLYHFIGFNALNNCEKIFLKTLKGKGAAKFYWDYDEAFVINDNDHPAGFFIRQNLKDFGNDMPAGWNFRSQNLSEIRETSWKVIDSPSDVSQVKIVSELLSQMPDISSKEGHHSAVILADENLLVPLLTSLPDNAGPVNITMGYPLKFSQVYTLIRFLIELQKNSATIDGTTRFILKDVINLLWHSLVSSSSGESGRILLDRIKKEGSQFITPDAFCDIPALKWIFVRHETPSAVSSWLKKILEDLYYLNNSEDIEDDNSKDDGGEKFRNEFIYRVMLALNRLESILSRSDVVISINTYFRLLDKILRGLNVPFSGEPLSGFQVMGILETRALDFRNLFILSVNEGVLPRTAAGSSYIPHNLREAFGLPTIKHQDSIYAYYFYRLLQRSENVTFIYNSNAEGLRTGEISRFLLQLSLLGTKPPQFNSLEYELNVTKRLPEIIWRSREHILYLEETYLGSNRKMLSPSAVNTWLTCTMKFFYRYVASIKEPDKPSSELDPVIFGKMLHSLMQKIYSPYLGRLIGGDLIDELKNDNRRIDELIFNILNDTLHNGALTELTGNDNIAGGILKKYCAKILAFDKKIAPFYMSGIEKRVSADFGIDYGNNPVFLTIGGVADRIDTIREINRIVDYKTGNVTREIKSVSSLFDTTDDKRSDAWFQVLMYCEILSMLDKGGKYRPAIYPVRNLVNPDFSEMLTIKRKGEESMILNDYDDIRAEFSEALSLVLEKIFNSDEPFSMTGNLEKCRYCVYARICSR